MRSGRIAVGRGGIGGSAAEESEPEGPRAMTECAVKYLAFLVATLVATPFV
jgi:hypothetical protein